MAVTNLHKPQKKHADKIARFALDAITAAAATLIDESDPQRGTIKLRVGFHSGPVVANVVGTKNPRCKL
jgi:class 3 adenylate cyclase